MHNTKLSLLVIMAAFAGVCTSPVAGMYAGASVGYLIDAEEEIYSAQLGWTVAEGESYNHNIEVEIGYTGKSDSGVDVDFIPVMANFKSRISLNGDLSAYLGAGAGLSYVDASGFGISDDDLGITLQFMAGVEFPVSDAVSISAGYRYIYLDNVKLFGVHTGSDNDDVVEVGFRFKF